MRIAIIGNSIVSNMAALYFRRRLPESAEIVVIGPRDRGRSPVVGESTIEITARFLEYRLGLDQYLRENHYPKYALTYYFKLDPENPADRTYSIHCNERAPDDLSPLAGWEGPMARPPSWQLNRHRFDRDLKSMVAGQPGIRYIEGTVKKVVLNGDSGHSLEIRTADGQEQTVSTDWVVDGSGRRRLLATQLGLISKAAGQRDCFWFRLADFDRTLLKQLNPLGPQPPEEGEEYHYDRYFSTHHFMGKGNWIWLIPLREENGTELISVGLSSHPDHYPYDVRNMDGFLEHVGNVHPVITDFVKSGRVIDTNVLRNYHYIADRVYSPDRWAVIGDAAFSPDPLFSNGLAFSSIQLEQLGEILARDCEGRLEASYVNTLSEAFLAPVVSSQKAITNWYPFMDDPYLSAMRLHWIEVSYFHILLPMVVNGCHYDPDRLALWNTLQLSRGGKGFDIPKVLVDSRNRFSSPVPDLFLYEGKRKVNRRALEHVSDVRQIREQVVDGGRLLNEYREQMLQRVDALAKLQNGS